MIVAGIHQTYGDIDLKNVKARDFFNIYLPNMSKDTAMMNLARIRSTPSKDLSNQERRIKLQNRIKPSKQNLRSSSNLISLFEEMGGGNNGKK